MPAALKMKCPSCEQALDAAAERCSHCRLSLRKLDLKFGAAPRHFGALTDRAAILSGLDQRKLLTLLQHFQSKFPQTTCSVFLTELPEGTAIGEYAFWLANRVRFSTIEASGANNFDVVLVLDLTAGAAGLTVGYGLEGHFTEEDLSTALEAGRIAFAEEEWAGGIERCVSALMERMREICRRTE